MKPGIDSIGVGVGALIFNDEKQHWVSPTYICEIVKGEPTIKEQKKCSAMGWFTIEEAEKLPLTIATQNDVEKMKELKL